MPETYHATTWPCLRRVAAAGRYRGLRAAPRPPPPTCPPAARQFWLTPAQADVLAHEHGPKASPHFFTGGQQGLGKGRGAACVIRRAGSPLSLPHRLPPQNLPPLPTPDPPPCRRHLRHASHDPLRGGAPAAAVCHRRRPGVRALPLLPPPLPPAARLLLPSRGLRSGTWPPATRSLPSPCAPINRRACRYDEVDPAITCGICRELVRTPACGRLPAPACADLLVSPLSCPAAHGTRLAPVPAACAAGWPDMCLRCVQQSDCQHLRSSASPPPALRTPRPCPAGRVGAARAGPLPARHPRRARGLGDRLHGGRRRLRVRC